MRKPPRPDGVSAAERAAAHERRLAVRARHQNESDQARERFHSSLDPYDPRWTAIAVERIRLEPWWWMEKFVYTNDPHDKNNSKKLFPMHKSYFKPIIQTILQKRFVFLVKSRQLMMTWLGDDLVLWRALFFDGAEGYIQALREEDADYQLQSRIKFTYDNLPDWQKHPDITFKYCKMTIPHRHSFIEAIPQGGSKMRGKVPSFFLSDEIAFQPEGAAAVEAVTPAIDGDAIFFGVSTPYLKNHFHRRIFPTETIGKRTRAIKPISVTRPIPESPLTVINEYNGHTVIFLHYTADPEKRDPEWIKRAKAKFIEAGGTEEGWQQEMELNFDVTGKPKLYSQYRPETHEKGDDEASYNPFLPLIRGWDFGYELPAAVFWQLNKLGQVVVLDALMAFGCEIEDFACQVIDYCKEHFRPGRYQGVEYPIKYRDYCDHAGTQHKDTGVTVKILRQKFGIRPRSRPSTPMERAKLIAHRLNIRDDGRPGLIVNRNCELMCNGFRGGFSSKPDAMGQPTAIPLKDGFFEHPHDAFGYSIDWELGVREANFDKELKKRAVAHRKYMDKKYNSIAGYSMVGA